MTVDVFIIRNNQHMVVIQGGAHVPHHACLLSIRSIIRGHQLRYSRSIFVPRTQLLSVSRLAVRHRDLFLIVATLLALSAVVAAMASLDRRSSRIP